MNPTVIIWPPGSVYHIAGWVGTVLAPNPAQQLYIGEWPLPVRRIDRAALNRDDLAERLCESWPEPKHE